MNKLIENLTATMFKIASEILVVAQAECVRTGATKEVCYNTVKLTLVEKFEFPAETAEFVINKIVELMAKNNIEC